MGAEERKSVWYRVGKVNNIQESELIVSQVEITSEKQRVEDNEIL